MTEEAYNGLQRMMQQNGIDCVPTREGHVVGRGKPYVPDREPDPPVIDYQMKRFMAAFGFCTFCICCMQAAGHGALNWPMKVAAWVLVIFFGIGLVRGGLQND